MQSSRKLRVLINKSACFVCEGGCVCVCVWGGGGFSLDNSVTEIKLAPS